MKDKLIQQLNSKTNLVATLILILGMIQEQFPLLKASLGEYQGWVYVGISAAMIILRQVTTTPISHKPTTLQNPLRK